MSIVSRNGAGHDGSVLPPIARRVDRALCDIDDRVDWLDALSPLHSQALWRAFEQSRFTVLPEPAYPPVDQDLAEIRRRLLDLPVDQVELPAVKALLWEKQHEIDRQIELIRLRGTPGLLIASIDFWGDAEPDLLKLAEAVLSALGERRDDRRGVGCDVVYAEAKRQLALYRERDARFASNIVIDPDLGAKLMVSRGHLHIAKNIEVPMEQVEPLIHHEIGTHALTRHNGSLQPLGQLACGLAHYDSLQEGLGVLAEYLSGHLAPDRVRVLAARVIATRMICDGEGVVAIYHRLVSGYRVGAHDAFEIALRAGRGGGLTKDVVYLRGLRQLLDHLRDGGAFEFLFVGKFALTQLPVLRELERDGLVEPPALLPAFLDSPTGRDRLHRCRSASLLELVTEDLPS
jgi:uncharacterized protein (TIGR02421 family)